MVKISDDDLRKILNDHPEDEDISLKMLIRASGWTYKEVKDFLKQYDERDIRTVGSEIKGRAIEDWAYFPASVKSYPVYRISDKRVPPEPATRPDIVDGVTSTGQDTVTVPIDQRFSEGELVRRIAAAGIPWDEAQDTVDWWKVTGDVDQVPTRGRYRDLYGDTMLITVARSAVREKRIKEIIMHTIPRTRWDPLAFYEYLQREFGWSRGESMVYFSRLRDEGTIERVRFRDYRIPRQIPIEVWRTVVATEEKPLAERVKAVTRWEARSGAGYKDYKQGEGVGQKRGGRRYDQEHELNAFVRIPRGTHPSELKQMAMDLLQLALDDHKSIYPSIESMMQPRSAGGWGATSPTMNTTIKGREDGEWTQLYNGEERQNGEFDPEIFYRAYGILVE